MSLRSLAIEHVGVRDVRNLATVEVDLSPGLNVVHGDNGHGKTTLLEALYLVASSRSFRTTKLGELVSHGSATASVRATLRESGPSSPDLVREQSAGIARSRVTVRIDGSRPPTLSAYATRTPVVVFHPDELALSSGPASLRRRLLDRLVLYREPAASEALVRYGEALRSRQDLLRRDVRGGSALDAYESICAQEGARVTRARAAAVDALAPFLVQAFTAIAEPGLVLAATHARGGADEAEAALSQLGASRDRDAHRASASFGPHRDDLFLALGGHPARTVASQGQHRALVLALKAAESSCIAAASSRVPILLLDDVSSELDPRRTDALFGFLAAPTFGALSPPQIVLTTTRPDLIPERLGAGGPRREIRLEKGAISK
jgi:DNA replication and repair protein RecF